MNSPNLKELFIEAQMEEFFCLGSCLDEKVTIEMLDEDLTEEEFDCKLESLIRGEVEKLISEDELEKALGY